MTHWDNLCPTMDSIYCFLIQVKGNLFSKPAFSLARDVKLPAFFSGLTRKFACIPPYKGVKILVKLAVITDSACDLAQDELAARGVITVPLTVSFGNDVYRDGVDLTRKEFYQLLVSSKEQARTAQPSPGAFESAYDQALTAAERVLVISLSSGLSGTYESALIAKEQSPEQSRITIFDSKAASIGQGLMVIGAAERAAAGQDMETVWGFLEHIRGRLASVFTLDTLEYLVRGGRLSRVQGFVGTMLNIKPLLQLDADGKIVPLEKVRGRKQAVERLLEIMAEAGHELAGQRVGICHARAVGEAEELAGRIRGRFKVAEIVIGEISAAIGSHTGPGCLSVFFQR